MIFNNATYRLNTFVSFVCYGCCSWPASCLLAGPLRNRLCCGLCCMVAEIGCCCGCLCHHSIYIRLVENAFGLVTICPPQTIKLLEKPSRGALERVRWGLWLKLVRRRLLDTSTNDSLPEVAERCLSFCLRCLLWSAGKRKAKCQISRTKSSARTWTRHRQQGSRTAAQLMLSVRSGVLGVDWARL